MKNLKMVITAILLFVALAGIGSAVPPTNQNMGYAYDAKFASVTTADCKVCHVTPGADIHHYMRAKGNTILGCYDCHPMQGISPYRTMYIEKNCTKCHTADNKAFTLSPIVNLTQLRPPGRPHHNTTKNSSSALFQVAGWAENRQCNNCHGTSIIANYNDPHGYPSYDTSLITPFADYKINATVGGGRVWGGCRSCHGAGSIGIPEAPLVATTSSTHHEVRGSLSTGGYTEFGLTCTNCHVGDPSILKEPPTKGAGGYGRVNFSLQYPTYVAMFGWDPGKRMELRNNTLMSAGDMVNGTGCQQCHSVMTLHNIQHNADVTIPGKIEGFGHIGNNNDCEGCHKGWAGATENPFAGPISIDLNSVNPGRLTAGVATDVTLEGSNFVQDGYTTTVLVDGAASATKSITSTQIVVTIPASLVAGTHSIQVKKGDVTSGLRTFMVASPPTITSAKLTSGVLTITGTGFGNVNMDMVTINKAGGIILPSDSITSWTDTQIVAVSAAAVVGDTVTVTSAGSATATITAGTQPPADPTITSATLVVPKKSATGTLTIDGAALGNSGTVNDVYIEIAGKKGKITRYNADSITSWATGKIEAVVAKDWAGQTVNVNVGGKIATATIR